MTAMPQMVALFNGIGGGAAALVASSEYHDAIARPGDAARHDHRLDRCCSAVIGALTFSGSS